MSLTLPQFAWFDKPLAQVGRREIEFLQILPPRFAHGPRFGFCGGQKFHACISFQKTPVFQETSDFTIVVAEPLDSMDVEKTPVVTPARMNETAVESETDFPIEFKLD